ncbi:MAG: hypothetical protein L0956_01310 [Candidatus Mariimomonas ferrooxydans]
MYFSGKAPLLSFVELFHIVSALQAIIMIIAAIGLAYRASIKPLFLTWDATGIVIVYALNLIILYTLR